MIGPFTGDLNSVERVHIRKWWYTVVAGSFKVTRTDQDGPAEYRFNYLTRSHRFGEREKVMYVTNSMIDAISASAE